jgi:hypothetical protein
MTGEDDKWPSSGIVRAVYACGLERALVPRRAGGQVRPLDAASKLAITPLS